MPVHFTARATVSFLPRARNIGPITVWTRPVTEFTIVRRSSLVKLHEV